MLCHEHKHNDSRKKVLRTFIVNRFTDDDEPDDELDLDVDMPLRR